MSGAAAVRVQEIDLSSRVATFEGVFGGIVLKAKKGANRVPRLVTTDKELLDNFTPNGRVEVGYDLAYYSALAYLERANKLYVKGVMKDGLFAGAVVKSVTSPFGNAALGTGISDPDAFVFDDSIDQPALSEITKFEAVADTAGSLDQTGIVLFDEDGSVAFWIDLDNAGNPAPAWTSAYDRIVAVGTINTNDVDTDVASKMQAAIDADSKFSASVTGNEFTVTCTAMGDRDDAVDEGTNFTITIDQQGQDEIDAADDTLFIYESSPGAWGNDIGFKIITHQDDEDLVPEPDSFLVQVFKSSIPGTPVEQFFCSRILGKLDGFGRNMFVDDVMQASGYIRIKSNSAIAGTVYPKSQATILYMGGGSDGSAVTDSDMVNALQDFLNPDEVALTIMIDGGNTTPAYQIALDTLVKSRMDCVAILSTPYSAEINNDFMTELKNYRKSTLNLNSSYSALYTPHVLIQDRFNDRQIWVSPDGYVAGSISFNALNTEIWFPPAGFRRGILNVLDVRRRFTTGQMDELYNIGVNPIRFAPGRGIVIWGQKTLSSRPSSLDRLNVRLLLIVIEPALKEFLEEYLFEFNDVGTRTEVTVKIEAYLENIKGRRGIFDYQVVCDDSNNTPQVIDNNQLIVDVFIKPNKSIETIPLRIVIVSTGISFSDAQQAV